MENSKITPRYQHPGRTDPTKREIIAGLKDDPAYTNLQDKHWKAIEAMWDLAAEGNKASVSAIAKRVGVANNTIKRWRTRADFMSASEAMSKVLLHEYTPSLVNKALREAAAGDKRLLLFFMERIFPDRSKDLSDTPDLELNLTWETDESPFPVPTIVEAELVEEKDAG